MLPPRATLQAGHLQIAISRTSDGIRIAGITDAKTGKRIAADPDAPLFSVAVKHRPTARAVSFSADSGWDEVRTLKQRSIVQLQWIRRSEPTLRVLAQGALDAGEDAIRWRFTLRDLPADWVPTSVVFPRISLAGMDRVFYPQGPGRVAEVGPGKPFLWQGVYPSGWTTMQFMAAYDAAGESGFYVSMNDSYGSLCTLTSQGDSRGRLTFSYDHLPPAESSVTLSGEATWQVLRGDWVDAARLYREWVRREASWYPREFMSSDGRRDTPPWMRELCFWILDFGGPKEIVDRVKALQRFMGVPVGAHWYHWHQNPWDNDYPHFFPPKEGFREALSDLDRSSVYAMPYINGRYWDMRDRGIENREFASVRPWAAKKEDGGLYVDSFGSVESDGSQVQFAVMCPRTEVWKKRVASLTDRLFREYGARAVYVDSVGAGAAVPCYEPHHGHPVAGGTWWVESHRQMMSEIRASMGDDRIVTTEDTCEVYVRGFDGFLSWDWMWNDMVPAFPMVYSGAIQLFGRAYYRGEPRALAVRMKAAQQLVFGEQLGWIQPSILNEPEIAKFLRDLVELRHRHRRYFYAGEMIRPPLLTGNIPRITADWHFLSGRVMITTPGILAGAWRLGGRTLRIHVNPSDIPIEATSDGSSIAVPARSAIFTEE
jgi:hypothetical protein